MKNNPIVYVNGKFLLAEHASVSIFDRGFLMGDSVYEVSAVIRGKLIDNYAHLRRLARSLGELNMRMPISFTEIVAVQERLIIDNGISNGEIYLQITRGAGKRDFVIDSEFVPTIVMFPVFHDPLADDKKTLRIMTQPDIRWLRRDIKTTQLLAQSLAKTIAVNTGFDDVWMVDDAGYITEGSSNNAYIVKDGRIFTRAANHEILNGITRQTMFRIMASLKLELVEHKFTPKDAIRAEEAFITSAGSWAVPVVEIDGHIIGNGKPGVVAKALREGYIELLDELSMDK